MASKTNKLSASQAIEQVLGASRKPMRVPEIIEAAVPLTGLNGKTPGQTIYSVLYAEAKRGKASRFERTGKGTFRLRKGTPTLAERRATKAAAKEEAVEVEAPAAEVEAPSEAEVTPDPKPARKPRAARAKATA